MTTFDRRRNVRFGRGGTFKCGCCGRLTRQTGHGEESVELCSFCKGICEAQNQYQDGIFTEAELDRVTKELEAKYKRNFEAEQQGIENDELMYGGA